MQHSRDLMMCGHRDTLGNSLEDGLTIILWGIGFAIFRCYTSTATQKAGELLPRLIQCPTRVFSGP